MVGSYLMYAVQQSRLLLTYLLAANHPDEKKPPFLHGGRQVTQVALYLAVGIANSAPFSVLSGQRCMIDFCFV